VIVLTYGTSFLLSEHDSSVGLIQPPCERHLGPSARIDSLRKAPSARHHPPITVTPGTEESGGLADYELIETQTELSDLVPELAKEEVLAFDTEADSFYHYFDKTCLVQVATRKQIYLLDPLAMGGPEALKPLAPLFASQDIRTLFHAAEYDIYVLKRDCGFRFNNLFDTMVCAQLLGYSGIGLAALVERQFDIKLPKDEQRSDWSARPLRQKQLTYAAADVRYLIRVAERLEKELRKLDRLSWAEDEFRTLEKREWPDREFDRLGYLKIKGARALDPQSLSLLRELYLVRDKRAREVDRPAFKVLGNRTLLELAQKRPGSEKELGAIKGVTDLILRRFGREIMGAVERGMKRKHGPIPKSTGTGRKRMDRRTEHRLAVLKKWRGDKAKELALDPGVMCPNAQLESIAFENPLTAAAVAKAGVKAWFGRSCGSEIAQLLRDLEAENS